MPCGAESLSTGAANANLFNSDLGPIGNEVKSVVKSTAESFGYCPSDSTYSLVAVNDALDVVGFQLEDVASVQDIKFDWKSRETINVERSDIADAKTFTSLCHGRLSMHTSGSSDDFFKHSFDVLPSDTGKTFYYHAFSIAGVNKGEFMGPNWNGGPYTTTNIFQGVIYNSLDSNVSMTYPYSGQNFVISLEPHSFSTLTTSSGDSIRDEPNPQLSFACLPGAPGSGVSTGGSAATGPIHTIKLSKTGLATLPPPVTKNGPPSTDPPVPLTYTYELSGNGDDIVINVQGFNIGNYNQIGVANPPPNVPFDRYKAPTKLLPVRDITPIRCPLWYVSPTQAARVQGGDESTFAPLAGQVWAVYAATDYVTQQELALGKVTDLYVVRPRIDQQKAYLMVFAIETTSAAKAQQYLTNITAKIDTWLPPMLSSMTLDLAQPLSTVPTLITQTEALPSGRIVDRGSGIAGTLLLIDTFIPSGGTRSGTQYYEIYPGILQINSGFISSIVASMAIPAAKTQEVSTQVTTKLPAWIATYTLNKGALAGTTITRTAASAHRDLLEGLVPDLTTFIKRAGGANLFISPTVTADRRELNERGLQALYSILEGPVSLSRPPLLLQAGNGVYLSSGGKEPEGWPGILPGPEELNISSKAATTI